MNIEAFIALMIVNSLFFIVFILFYVDMRKKKSLLDIEKNQVPIFFYNNLGARIDLLNLTYPFVRLSVYKDFFVISYSKKLVFMKEEVLEFKIISGGLSSGVQIIHNKNTIPKKIIIWTSNPEKLCKEFFNASYNVKTI